MVGRIGDDRISELVDRIEELECAGINVFSDLEGDIAKALVCYSPALVESINEEYELTPAIEAELNDILGRSFQLYDEDSSHQSACMMLVAEFDGDRLAASKALVARGINGFKYRWGDVRDFEGAHNYCVMNVDLIRNIQVSTGGDYER